MLNNYISYTSERFTAMTEYISHADLRQFFSENCFSFFLIGALLVVIFAYRDIRLPATGNFLFIILVLFLMIVSASLERWAVLSESRRSVRITMSVTHYVLQPFVIWLELISITPQKIGKHRLKMFLLSLPVFCNAFIYLIAPLSGRLVFWFDRNYVFHRGPLGYSIYIVTFFYIILLLLCSFLFLRQNDRRRAIILFYIAISGVIIGILEGFNLMTGYVDEVFALGISVYYMYLVILHELELQAGLARKDLEISENRVRLLQEQIRPHFVFNSLHIIKSLIRTDQEKAVCCVEDFSDYLRANLEVMTTDKLIPFDDELAHIDAFTSLALADKSKKITVEYDIQERYFRVPPLTIEPLMENAIQHGIGNGGTVLLSSRRVENGIVITVSDNGQGMEKAKTNRAKKRDGISLENVRTRLRVLCGGTLEISSGEQGTVVTVYIPNSQ